MLFDQTASVSTAKEMQPILEHSPYHSPRRRWRRVKSLSPLSLFMTMYNYCKFWVKQMKCDPTTTSCFFFILFQGFLIWLNLEPIRRTEVCSVNFRFSSPNRNNEYSNIKDDGKRMNSMAFFNVLFKFRVHQTTLNVFLVNFAIVKPFSNVNWQRNIQIFSHIIIHKWFFCVIRRKKRTIWKCVRKCA